MPTLLSDGILLEHDWSASERGNTWLYSGDSQALWVELRPGCWLALGHDEGNSPYWHVAVTATDADAIWAHIHANLGGWSLGRWNLPTPARTCAYDATVIVGDDDVRADVAAYADRLVAAGDTATFAEVFGGDDRGLDLASRDIASLVEIYTKYVVARPETTTPGAADA